MQESLVAKPQRLRKAALLARYGTGLIFLLTFIGTHYPGNVPYDLHTSDNLALRRLFAAYGLVFDQLGTLDRHSASGALLSRLALRNDLWCVG